MGFFWFIEPWRALLGKERNSAKTSEPVKLAKAFCDWGKANPAHRQAAARISSSLAREGYKTLADLEQATDAELLKLKGVGPYALKLIREIGGTYYGSPTK